MLVTACHPCSHTAPPVHAHAAPPARTRRGHTRTTNANIHMARTPSRALLLPLLCHATRATLRPLRHPLTSWGLCDMGGRDCGVCQVVTGAKSEEQARTAARKYARIIQKLDFPIHFTDFKIQACMHIGMHAGMHVSGMHLGMHVGMHVSMHAGMQAGRHTGMHKHLCRHTCTCLTVYGLAAACMHARLHVHGGICTAVCTHRTLWARLTCASRSASRGPNPHPHPQLSTSPSP